MKKPACAYKRDVLELATLQGFFTKVIQKGDNN